MVKQAPAPAGSERSRARVGQGSRKTEPPLITQVRYRSGAMVDQSRYERTILTGTQNRRHQGDDVGGFPVSGGGGIRTRDLWVMSPTSCRCSTPRRLGAACALVWVWTGGVCPQRPRLPRGRPRSTLRRWTGSRPGSGWDRVEPVRSRPRTHRPRTHTQIGLGSTHLNRGGGAPARRICSRGGTGRAGGRNGGERRGNRGDPPSAMSTGRLRSVARRPPPASQPGRLPGAFLVSDGETRLGAGFPLRCFQRFAHPDVATQRCRFPDNWHTSGPSSPVLSY